ncbi:polyprenyl synthetase family protein [Clostridium thermobutyricum]|uniref:polyprenyl synthetase family protein n=1 Tax=Clostridium thermobutyricum TaxID=29372 RepID=UPI0018ABE3CA|nr:polyprenyl synthetase family protein [Clostridium thermobutyricum]
MKSFWSNYPEIGREVEKIKKNIIKNAKCKDKVIENSIVELVESGGKMLRPGFTVLASKFGEYEEERAIALGSVVEMFHMATLVHDDVIDDAELRRGKRTIQSKYGKNYAVYIGDYLFCLCFKTLGSTSSLKRDIQIDTKVMSRICLGEVEQLNSRYKKDITIKDYLKRISGKTAELFSLSLYIGAIESGCDKKTSRLFWEIGHNIGMAFQIIDDILDLTGDSNKTGKAVGNDLLEGVYTLPLLIALRNNKEAFDKVLKEEEYSKEEILEIIDLIKENGGIEKSMEIANKYSNKAFKNILNLPENEYRDILMEITKNMLSREQ